MRVAVMSDIHANLPALEAVLAAIALESPDEVWCLGDLVGYGPHPNECVAAVEGRADICLAGNHDLGVLGTLSLDEFSLDAAAAAEWSQSVLEAETRAFLEALTPLARRDEAELFHASARDPVWEYVLTQESAAETLALTHTPLVLVGHSHVALAITTRDNSVAGSLAPEGWEVELPEGRWLLNPGSVGQPRDRDPRAAWLMVDFDAGRAEFRRVAYPVEETQAAIRERGLPDALAARLEIGE
jgi:diadenosine tetraphosphatase ApaH/serine/threonine PP2A family protein phosphatase